MAEISLPTASKQDTILNNINDIKTKQNTVLTNTDDTKIILGNTNPTVANETNVMNFLKKINLTQLPQGGIKPNVITGPAVTPSNTVLANITGSGFLRKAVIAPTTVPSNGFISTFKVTIDGAVYTWTANYNATTEKMAIGITDGFLIAPYDPSKNTVALPIRSTTFFAPTTVNFNASTRTFGLDIVNLSGMRIPFNNSLKIEASSNMDVARYYDIMVEVY